MSIRVNTNVDAFEAQRNLGRVSLDFSRAVTQLSSGLRISSAADDAAGLAISQKLKGQITGFDQGSRNAQDAISMSQTAESALGTTESILQRMRQLSVQAANDTYTTQDRQNIQAEINQLISEIDRIATQTDFNTQKLLNGSAGAAQATGGGPNIKSLVIQAGVAVATTFSMSVVQDATKSALEASQADGSFFTQQSSITITGGLGTQTFTAQSGESLEDFFQVVNNSGIGVTMQADQTNGDIVIVNNNFGINTGTGLVLTGPTAATVVDNGITYPRGTVFTGGPEAVTVSAATGDFATTGLCMQFGSATIGSVSGVTGTYSGGSQATNAVVKLSTAGGTTIVTATGLNSDVIDGAGTSAGIQLTLEDPGNIHAGSGGTAGTPGSFSIVLGGGTVTGLSLNQGAAVLDEIGIDSNSGNGFINVIDHMFNVGGAATTITTTASLGNTFTLGGLTFTISGLFSSEIIKVTPGTAGTSASASDTFAVSQNKALQFHVGANAQQTIAAAIDSANSQALGVGSLNVLTQPDAETSITQLDRAVQAVSANRSSIGALINRLTDSLTNDQSAQENASASNSRIEDVNVAQATVQFTRDQIVMQASTSVLAQANQSASGILSLLR